VLLGGTGKALDLVIYGALIMAIAVFQPAGLIGFARRLVRGGPPGVEPARRQESAA
jgi:branched-chain amino acid transport system permease protein